MAKARNKKQKHPTISVYERKLSQLTAIFPKVKVTMLSDEHPTKAGKDFVTDVVLPNGYTLLGRGVSANGEITSVKFSVQKKHCTENQKPGVYYFSA